MPIFTITFKRVKALLFIASVCYKKSSLMYSFSYQCTVIEDGRKPKLNILCLA